LDNKINSIYKGIKDLNEKIKNNGLILEKNEKLLSIFFEYAIDNQNRLNICIICKNTDSISKIEEEIYNKFNLLKTESFNYFYKGYALDKFQTFAKNYIEIGDTIYLEKN
jgi:hypothetical protein